MPSNDLTPIERQLFLALQDLTTSLTDRADRQERKIADLEYQIAARDKLISDLANLFEALLGPSALQGSSLS